MSTPLTPDEESFERNLQELARMLLSGQTAEGVLGSVTSLAQRALPNCDAASISLLRDGRAMTPVCSAELALDVDQSQYTTGQGPCLDAIRTGKVIHAPSLAEADAWPTFSAQAKEKGVCSVLSLPLQVRDDVIGAMNLYSRTEGGFESSEESASVFAVQAAAVLANAIAVQRAEELAQHLTTALEHRDVIGQAKGILMATEGIGPDDAFDLLRRASQRANRKLYDMAVEMVERRRGRRTSAKS